MGKQQVKGVIQRTHCKRGHPYSPENTLIKTTKGRSWRQCRECSRILLWGDRYREKANGFLGPTKGPDRVRCKRGHLATPENTYVIVRRNGRIDRECRDCDKDRKSEFDLSKIKDRMSGLVQFLKDGGTIAKAEDAKILNQYDWDRFRAQQPRAADRLKKLSFRNAYARKRLSRVSSPAVTRRHSDTEIMACANAAVPPRIDDRGDIISAMILAHLEGHLPLSQMSRRWVEFRKAHTAFTSPRFNPLAHHTQRHLPVMSMESTMLFSQDSDGVALGTLVSDGFWTRTLSPEDYLIIKEGEAA